MRYISFVFIVGNFQFNLPSQDWPGVSNNIVFFDTILQIAPKFQKLDKHIYTGKIEPLFVDRIFDSFDLLDIWPYQVNEVILFFS